MRKRILIVVASLALLVGAFVLVVALQPSDFRVARSATIEAPIAAVFAQVDDLHNWEGWSPWAKLDPAAKKSFEGPAAGRGAVFRWAGNQEIGEGSMTIIESRPGDLIRIDLSFKKPFAASSLAEFTFKPEGGRTTVAWSMSGRNSFLAKAICLFMNMDKTLGGEFERGLAQLKAVVESKSQPAGN